MDLYAAGFRYSQIAKLTRYSFNGVRKIVQNELSKRVMSDETAAECRAILSTKLDLVMERLEEYLIDEGQLTIDEKMLDKYLKTISLRAAISLPKMPTRIDLVTSGPASQAIQMGEDLHKFMNAADLMVANRLGSGRHPEDVIDVDGSRPGRLELPAQLHSDQGGDSPT